MKRQFQKTRANSGGKKIKSNECLQLPIYDYQDRILADIRSCASYIVISTTGSGKTTQIPKMFLCNKINNDKAIAVSQPRRIATINIASRVAEEMDAPLGDTIGYSVRFDHRFTPNKTKIKFMTDGILIRESITDPLLKSYSIIVLDEIHERSLNNDVLLGIVRNAQKTREIRQLSPLKIVLMSATIDPKPFIEFLGPETTKFLEVDTRAHQLIVKSIVRPEEDYVRASVAACLELHLGRVTVPNVQDFVTNWRWSVLIFLTGEDEIRRCCALLSRNSALLIEDKKPGLIALPLFSALSKEMQNQAVSGNEETESGLRRVIVSTNIAETSITIPGVRVVIDCGLCKQKFVNPQSGLESLQIRPISQGQAEQRAGRAARLGPGVCFRLYTPDFYKSSMPKEIQPELLRSSLLTVSLTIFGLGLKNIFEFSWFDKPDKEQVIRSVDKLLELQAIELVDKNNFHFQITDLGKLLLKFPLDPRLSLALLEASKENRHSLVEVSAIIAVLNVVDKLFYNDPNADANQTQPIFDEFYSHYGDLIFLLKIFRAFCQQKTSEEKAIWCQKHSIKLAEMRQAVNIHKQLKDVCHSLQLPMKTCQDKWVNVLKCFIKPFRSQIARQVVSSTNSKHGNKFQKASVYSIEYSNASIKDVKLNVHPSSVLCSNRRTAPELVLYIECIETEKVHMKYVSEIHSDWMD